MSRFNPDSETFKVLKDKVIVLTGGANGIGRATVTLLHSLGAHVVFGDIDEQLGTALSLEISSSKTDSQSRVHFLRTDVSKYADNLALFKLAHSKFGHVDHAFSIAGVVEQGNWFDPNLDLKSVEEVPPTMVLDVNLLAVLYFARIAAVYLTHDAESSSSTTNGSSPKGDKSIVLLSSVAAFKETPGLFVYQATKHGVLGLMRSTRPYLPKSHGIRVNAVCPWMTRTGMVAGIEDGWYQAGLPVNEPVDVGRVVVGLAATEGVNGKAVYVEGGRGWDIEEGMARTMPQWLGRSKRRV